MMETPGTENMLGEDIFKTGIGEDLYGLLEREKNRSRVDETIYEELKQYIPADVQIDPHCADRYEMTWSQHLLGELYCTAWYVNNSYPVDAERVEKIQSVTDGRLRINAGNEGKDVTKIRIYYYKK